MSKDWLPPQGLPLIDPPGVRIPPLEERLEALLLRIEPVLKKLEAHMEAEASTGRSG